MMAFFRSDLCGFSATERSTPAMQVGHQARYDGPAAYLAPVPALRAMCSAGKRLDPRLET